MAKTLTVKSLENLKSGSARQEIPDGLIRGLYFVVQPSGAKSWAVRYRFRGKPRKLTLGSYPELELKPARDLASAKLVAVAKGEDPATEKQAAKKAATPVVCDEISTIVTTFLDRHAKRKNKESHASETARILHREIVGPWEGRRLSEITRADVHELLDAVADRAPIMANRTLAAARRMGKWAAGRGSIEKSPFEGIEAPAEERSRERVLFDDEIQLAWSAFDKAGWPFGPLAKLLLITGARRDEVAAMTWAEVDIKTKTWTLPAARAKNNQIHEIPLSDAAIAIIEALPRIEGPGGLIFTTNGKNPVSGFSRAKREFDEHIANEKGEPIPAWRLHDLRRTAATGMAALKIAPHVVDAVLNHKSGTIKGVSAIYMRYNFAEEKRTALDAWGRCLAALVTGAPAGNVIEMARARA